MGWTILTPLPSATAQTNLLHFTETDISKFTAHPSQLEFKTFIGDDLPKYAILSHTWDEKEVLYQDLKVAMGAGVDSAYDLIGMKEYAEIARTCKQALADGLHYA